MGLIWGLNRYYLRYDTKVCKLIFLFMTPNFALMLFLWKSIVLPDRFILAKPVMEAPSILSPAACVFFEGFVNRHRLFGLAAIRLIEDVLPDLDSPDIFVGPIWSYFSIVEIQSSVGWVLELPVEGLAGDFLGV